MAITKMIEMENGNVAVEFNYYNGEEMVTAIDVYTAWKGLVFTILDNGSLDHVSYKNGYFLQARGDTPLLKVLKKYYRVE